MHKLAKICCILFIAILSSNASAEISAKSKPLQLGIVPYIGTRSLVTSYEPMRLYLEKALGKPVEIYTATGFKSFYLNAQRGDFDLVISSAHFARILQKKDLFVPLARYSKGGRGLIVKRVNNRKINNFEDLRGQIIAMPDQLSLASIVCMTYLRENGLQAGVDFRVLEVPSFASAIFAVKKGDAIAAISAPGAIGQMPAELREAVKPFIDTGEFVSLVFLANPRLDKATTEQLKSVLLKFSVDTPEGKKFFGSNAFGSLITATTDDMNNLDPYLAETERLMKATR